MMHSDIIYILAVACVSGMNNCNKRSTYMDGPTMCNDICGRSNSRSRYDALSLTCRCTRPGSRNNKSSPTIVVPSAVNNKASYGERCSDSRQCDYRKGYCLDGVCACVIGYSNNFTIGQCVEKCSIYGDTFSAFTNSFAVMCNVVAVVSFKPQQCVDLCRHSNDITCTYAEYRIPKCHLCNQTVMSGQRFGYQRKWSLYVRHCRVDKQSFD